MTEWPRVSVSRPEDYRSCFGCGQDNPIGLKLAFKWDGRTAREEFTPGELYQGWPGLLHGGIVACLLDEGMAYAAIFSGHHCVTARMQVKLRRTARIGETLVISARVTRSTRKLVETEANVTLRDGTLIAEGTATHFIAEGN